MSDTVSDGSDRVDTNHPPEQLTGLLSPRHRLVLSRVAARGGSTSVVILAGDVAAHVTDQPRESVPPELVRQAFIDVHSSLETLSRGGYIEYCEDVGTVALRASLQ